MVSKQELQLDFPLQDVRHEAVLSVMHTANALAAAATALLHPFNLTTAQFNVLLALGYKDKELTQSDLGKRLVVTRASITSVLDRLEGKGLVLRKDVPHNRRIYHVALTPKGAALVEEVEPLYLEIVGRITEDMKEEDCRRLTQELQSIRRQLEKARRAL